MPQASTVIAREILTIRSSFSKLARSFGRIAPLLAATAARPRKGEGRRKPRLSMSQRKALKLQGKYMGTMRGLSPAKRAQVKRVRATKGIHAAIAHAVRLSR